MPIDVGKFTTEITVADGELPLSGAQIEKLVQLLMRRIEEKRRADEKSQAATAIRGSATQSSRLGQ